MSDLDSWDSVDAKNGLIHLHRTPDTRDTKCVLKWVLVRIAAFCCARRPQIWIPETEYYQKVSSHAQIRPQGAEKQLRKVRVGGGWWWVVGGGWVFVQRPEQLLLRSRSDLRSLSIWLLIDKFMDSIIWWKKWNIWKVSDWYPHRLKYPWLIIPMDLNNYSYT